jgi:hypothetical protein
MESLAWWFDYVYVTIPGVISEVSKNCDLRVWYLKLKYPVYSSESIGQQADQVTPTPYLRMRKEIVGRLSRCALFCRIENIPLVPS